MPVASWIVATHFRPRLLRVALESIRDNTYPEGWTAEVVVAHMDGDNAAVAVARELGAIPVSTTHKTGGGKRNAALKASTGELILVADDDDSQSPWRAEAAIAAYKSGRAISELREFRYLHIDSGMVVRWCGAGGARPPVLVGTARNYRRTLLARVNGWKSLPRLIEKDIQARIQVRVPSSSKAFDMGTAQLSDTTICLQHTSNIWDDRPRIPLGESLMRGDYRLVGEGHWTEAPRFPRVVAERLALP